MTCQVNFYLYSPVSQTTICPKGLHAMQYIYRYRLNQWSPTFVALTKNECVVSNVCQLLAGSLQK